MNVNCFTKKYRGECWIRSKTNPSGLTGNTTSVYIQAQSKIVVNNYTNHCKMIKKQNVGTVILFQTKLHSIT